MLFSTHFFFFATDFSSDALVFLSASKHPRTEFKLRIHSRVPFRVGTGSALIFIQGQLESILRNVYKIINYVSSHLGPLASCWPGPLERQCSGSSRVRLGAVAWQSQRSSHKGLLLSNQGLMVGRHPPWSFTVVAGALMGEAVQSGRGPALPQRHKGC